MVGTNNSIWEVVYSDLANGIEEFGIDILMARENGTLEYFLPFIEVQLDKTLGTIGSKCYIIKYGINETELLENFDNFLDIAKNLGIDDEVYIDITHSFRSLSLMSFVMSEAVSNSREIPLNIKGVYYGMLEYSRENNGVTPIVDLKLFFEFLEWSKAIRAFKQYGNSRDLLMLINNKGFNSVFTPFSDALSMSNMKSLRNSVTQLKARISELKKMKYKIYEPIFNELDEFVKRLDTKSFALFQYNLAKWYEENHNYALSYIVLAEAVVSAICEDSKLDEYLLDDREEAKNIIRLWQKNSGNSKEKISLGSNYVMVNRIRNDIAHAKDNNSKSASKSIDNLKKYIKNLYPLFKGKK